MKAETLTLAQTLQLIQTNPYKTVVDADFDFQEMSNEEGYEYYSELEEDTVLFVMDGMYHITIKLSKF